MSDLRILVVDDEEKWREELAKILRRLGGDVRVDTARDFKTARQKVANYAYDLATVDLQLIDEAAEPSSGAMEGMQLLRDLRGSPRNQACGLLVLTGYPSTDHMRRALKEYNANDFIEKSGFDSILFLDIARGAICDARLRHAEERAKQRYRLTVTFNQGALVGSELDGPGNQTFYVAQKPPDFDVADLARRANNLNFLILRGGADIWRPEAQAIGKALYETLMDDRRISDDLAAARALAKRSEDLVLQFRGPAVGLGSPFELLHDGGKYLSFNHILTRRLVHGGPSISRKPEPFHVFLKSLLDKNESLRILIVGANSDGNIPAAEAEAAAIEQAFEADLQRLGIAHEIHTLKGDQASYGEVSEALSEGGYHIFHYAGHGRYEDKLPEVSGLILQDGDTLRALTAGDLNFIVGDTDLRMVFLSCCLGARTAASSGSGDFSGVFEALAEADVPIVLGYRWTVRDDPAQRLALDFYQQLWRSFAPGDALLEARRRAAQGQQGRNDETWAAPVLLMQTQ